MSPAQKKVAATVVFEDPVVKDPVPIIDTLAFARAGATPRSQKATGIRGLSDIFRKKIGYFPSMAVPPHFLVQDPSDLNSDEWKNHELSKKERLFVRPCPTVPRHGFVESREIQTDGNGKTAGLVTAILDEAIAADPGSEVLLSEPIDCIWSAIWTPDRISFGNGNDGATAGNNFLSLSLSGANPFSDIQEEYGVNPPDYPYSELLCSKQGTLTAVQFRGGPQIGSCGPNIVPFDTLVKRVFQADGSLLEHEKLVLSLGPGDVVYRIGDSPISHYAAHCVAHKIPYVTDHEPVVGEFLPKSSDIPDFDIESLRKGLLEGYNIEITNQAALPEVAKMCVIVTHYSQFFRTGDSAVALGRFCALLVRISAALCLNEVKYCQTTGEFDALKNIVSKYPAGRNAVYMAHVNKPAVLRPLLRNALDAFMYGEWSSAYGGIKWGNCSIYAVDLDNLISKIMNYDMGSDADQLLASKISMKMHALVNACHNGGKLLTKVLSSSFLDKAASGDSKMALELLVRYAQSVWEKQDTGGFIPADKIQYHPEILNSPAKCEQWWKGSEWTSQEDAKKTVVVKEPEPIPPTVPVVADVYKHKFNIRAQVRHYNGDQYRFQITWDHLNWDDMPKPKIVQDKALASKKKMSEFPEDYPYALKKDHAGSGWNTNYGIPLGGSGAYVGKKQGHTENTLHISGIPNGLRDKMTSDATLPSTAGTGVLYYPMTWKWVDDTNMIMDLDVDGTHMIYFDPITKQTYQHA